ncbi:unnamed protein product [Lampetra planeri]
MDYGAARGAGLGTHVGVVWTRAPGVSEYGAARRRGLCALTRGPGPCVARRRDCGTRGPTPMWVGTVGPRVETDIPAGGVPRGYGA